MHAASPCTYACPAAHGLLTEQYVKRPKNTPLTLGEHGPTLMHHTGQVGAHSSGTPSSTQASWATQRRHSKRTARRSNLGHTAAAQQALTLCDHGHHSHAGGAGAQHHKLLVGQGCKGNARERLQLKQWAESRACGAWCKKGGT